MSGQNKTRAGGSVRSLPAAARQFSPTAAISRFPGGSREEAPVRGRAGQDADPRRDWFCAQIEANKAAMFRLARSILHSDADAEDAVAEAVLRSFVHLDGLRKQDSVKSWLMRITANEAYRILQRRRDTVPLEELAREPAAPRRDVENEMGLWDHVKALPDSLRAPVVLFYYEELPVSEIADILALTPGAVKTRLSRARVLLRMRLEQEDER